MVEREAIWALHFLNAGSQAVTVGDLGDLGLSSASKQDCQGDLWGTTCVHEKGRPSTVMTQGHRSESVLKQLMANQLGKVKGTVQEKGWRQESRLRRGKEDRWNLKNPFFINSLSEDILSTLINFIGGI